MDPILMQKFEAIKKSKKCKKQLLVDKIFLYIFIAFSCSLCCSCPFWLPYLSSSSSMKDFLSIFLPKMSLIIYSPKLLFLIGNLIVAFLIGESKFFASTSSSFSSSVCWDGYYDEYIDRSRTLRSSSTMEMKKEMKMTLSEEETAKKTSLVPITRKTVEENREVKKGKKVLQRQHELVNLPTEEFKRRADDFIARVNRQRRLEAGLLSN